jgi:UDP-3-O-[3-hydroxymyristoyl] glucosamine N-acyltransferase
VESCLARSEQFQELDKKLTKEANKLLEEVRAGHIPIFQHWIETKLECIKKSKTLVIQNPNLTIHELAQLLDDRIENEAQKLRKTKTFEKMEEICNNLSALEWTRNIVRTVDLKYRQL